MNSIPSSVSGNVRYPHLARSGEVVRKDILYHVQTGDDRYVAVCREDLEPADGFHHWWYKLLATGADADTGMRDMHGSPVCLNDVLLVPYFDFSGRHTSWSAVVAMMPEPYSRFADEPFVFKTLFLGWQHRVRPVCLEGGRAVLTDYACECIRIGLLGDFVTDKGYLTDYSASVASPDGKPID